MMQPDAGAEAPALDGAADARRSRAIVLPIAVDAATGLTLDPCAVRGPDAADRGPGGWTAAR